ncbi:MAG: CRISPR-associated helicase Cas3' [Cyanobacteriota bacterium]
MNEGVVCYGFSVGIKMAGLLMLRQRARALTGKQKLCHGSIVKYFFIIKSFVVPEGSVAFRGFCFNVKCVEYSSWLPLLSRVWAKSPSGGMDTGYPLLQHLLDVGAVARELMDLVPCPVPLPCSSSWVAALVGFHDMGKASPGFQKKLANPAASAGAAGAPDRHDASTVPMLMQQLTRRNLDHSSAWSLANAVAAHHGSLINSVDLQAAGRWRFTHDWLSIHDQLFTGVIAGSGAEGLPILPADAAARNTFLQWLMGLTTVADWIGSSDAICCWDRLEVWEHDPAAWFAGTRQLAQRVFADIGFAGGGLQALVSGADAVERALAGRLPRPLQSAVAEVIDQLGDQAGLVVIEAPMGEGKTEAGLALAHGRGLYVAMPTQATSNALFTRIAEFLSRAAVGPVQLALAHGAGGPEAACIRLREVGLGTSDSGISAGWWFRGGKRALLCPHGIGTVDQSLIGVMNVRHAFVRMFALSGRTVIFDEVHAYDAYTGGLIERLVIWLQSLGCRVVLMSATLPAARRDSLLQAWAKQEVGVPTAPYPRLTWAVPGSVQTQAFPASRLRQVRMQGIAADDVAATAVAMAQCGARVLVVVNKVARAQAIFQVVALTVPTTLFHARFPMDQRLEIEQRVLEQFGPGGSCHTGHVLVATQVAEQSLDIDMDVLITDIAPVDLVLQRTGRIHRHDRQRSAGFTEPLVLVAGLDQMVPPRDLTAFVYDEWTVLRSAAWLQAHPDLQLPDDIDSAVQAVYGAIWEPEPGPLADAIDTALADHRADGQAMLSWSEQAALPKPADWAMQHPAAPLSDEQAEQGTSRFGTRLGQASISVVPVTAADLVNLSGHTEALAKRYLRISHPRLMATIRASPLPTSWREQPGLHHHWPLLLDEDNSGPGYRLDLDLGLVIGKSNGSIA